MLTEASRADAASSLLVLLLPILAIIALMVLSRRRAKTAELFSSQLQVGQEVMTTSGIFARITALDGSVATIDVSEGVTIRIDRRALTAPIDTQETR